MSLDIVALGYFGFNNLGDEAILSGMTSALRNTAVFRDANMTALTFDPGATRRLHPGVTPVPRRPLRTLSRRMPRTDLFVLGGGSLFQDATSLRSVVWYTMAAAIARAKSRRVLWWAHGIGPLHSPIARRLVAMTAHKADAVTVRDPASALLLKECGFSGSVEVVPDPAFLLATPEPKATRAGSVVAWRSWAANSGPPRGAFFPEPVRALPMHPSDDAAFRGDGRIDWLASDSPFPEVLDAIAAARLVVAVRLHALIFATAVATPFVAVSYDPKVTALAESVGEGDACIPLAACDAQALEATIGRVMEGWSDRHARLRAQAGEFRARAARPAHMAAEWFA